MKEESNKTYTPGNEPEVIKKKVASVLRRLNEYYPNRVITSGISNDHKHLGEDISKLCRLLGYSDYKAMLEAYGFSYSPRNGGRIAQDYQEIIDFLMNKYKDVPKLGTVQELREDNPELAGNIKTLQNTAIELFGVTLKVYFKNIGLIDPANAKKKAITIIELTEEDKQKNIREYIAEKNKNINSNNGKNAEAILQCLEGMSFKQDRCGKITLLKGPQNAEKLIIPKGIDYIAGGAFKDNKSLKEIVINADITEIFGRTFYGCKSLTKVSIPESVSIIWDMAFYNCSSLRTVTLPISLKKIGAGAFEKCEKLKNVKGYNDDIEIGEDAFAFTEFYFNIPKPDYSYEKNVEGITITKINKKCKNITIPEIIDGLKVTRIGSLIVENDDVIEKITIPRYVDVIDCNAFKWCLKVKEILMPESIKLIGQGAFYGCTALKKVKVPENVEVIYDSLFENCENLKAVELPKGLKIIKEKAFKGCLSLEKIVIPNEVERLSEEVFQDCGLLTEVYLPQQIKAISKRLFCGCTMLKTISIPDSVEVIDEAAFKECNRLSEVHFPVNLRRIEGYSFWGCGKLHTVNIPEKVEYIGERAFAECNSLVEVDISDSVDLIENSVFENCEKLTKVRLPKNLKMLNNCLFNQCISLKEVLLPNEVQIIGDDAFACCALKEIVLPKTVREIGKEAFGFCEKLSRITLSPEVENVGKDAFYGTDLKDITFLGDLETKGLFKEFKGVKRIVVPQGKASILREQFGEVYDEYYAKSVKDVIIYTWKGNIPSEEEQSKHNADMKAYVKSILNQK